MRPWYLHRGNDSLQSWYTRGKMLLYFVLFLVGFERRVGIIVMVAVNLVHILYCCFRLDEYFPFGMEMRCKLHSGIPGRADGWTPLPMTTASLSSSAMASCSLWRSAADTSHTVSMLVNILSTSTTWQDTSVVTSVGCHGDKLWRSASTCRFLRGCTTSLMHSSRSVR